VDETIADLITKNESLTLRLCAVENALLQLSGFSKSDNSPQGRIVFERKQALQVEPPMVRDTTTETGVTP